MTKNEIKLILDNLKKKLSKGCGRSEEYWGHNCGIWITNTQNKNVQVFCNRCVGKFEIIKILEKIWK